MYLVATMRRMRNQQVSVASLVVAATTLAAVSCERPAPFIPVDLLIRNVTLVSPERPRPLPAAWVAVAGGHIISMGQGNDDQYKPRLEIDGAGRFLAPGLIDAHVHFSSVPGVAPGQDYTEELRRAVEAYEVQLPRSYLFFGFTTVIDLNVCDRDFIRRFEQADVGPDLYHCGNALTLANGYPMVLRPLEERFNGHPNFLWDERQADRIPDRFRPEDHTASATVARVAAMGGVCVKTFWEDGFLPGQRWPTPPAELIASVIEESRAKGLTVTMHANSYDAYRFAVDANVDLIAHGLWTWDGLETESGLPAPIAHVLDNAIAQGIGIMPTSRVLGAERDLFQADFLRTPRLQDAVPRALLNWYERPEAQSFKMQLQSAFGDVDDATIYDLYGGVLDRAQRVVTYLIENDARLVFGSDTPSAPSYANPPGLNGLLEMESLRDAGATPQRIFRAATLDVAKAFHLEEDVGSIEVGKVANLLLLEGNPLDSIEAWSQIDTVVVRGVAVDRDELSARN